MLSAKINDTEIRVGDTVRVHTRVVEGSRSRIQVFEGLIISLRGRDVNRTFTVRRIGAGQVGVERTWPLDARSIAKIEIKKNAKKVRRSKLYYLRDLIGKSAVRV